MRLRLLVPAILVTGLTAAIVAVVSRTGAEETAPKAARADARTATPKKTSDGVAIDQRWPGPAELRWLDRFARWEPLLHRAGSAVFASIDDGERGAARSAAKPFARCVRGSCRSALRRRSA